MTSALSGAGKIACLIIVILIAGVPLLGSAYLIDITTEILIFALFALSLNIIIGYSGSVSFGHAAYFAIGGYVNAILLTTYHWPLIPAFIAGVLAATAIGGVVAYFCTRLTDIYFAMLTLAFSMLVWAILFKWRSVTNGDDGFVGVTVPAIIDDRTAFFYFTMMVVVASIAVMWVITHSAFGRTLVAVRENLGRAGFVGVPTRRVRWQAFVVAAFFAGVAGALFGMLIKGMYVESAFWTQSAQVLIMTLLGGIYSFFGPLIGAAVLFMLERLTNEYTQYWPSVLGTILLVILLFLPDGLVGLGRRISAKARGKSSGESPS
jgi:branched-chain amino acid transport system permease protein